MYNVMRGKPLQSVWYVLGRIKMMRLIKELYSYRGFISSCVKREFQSKYTNSLFGLAWNIINPLSMVFVYTVIFSQVMRARLPGVDTTFAYSIYLCAGVLTWGLFAEITTRSQTMFIDNSNLLKKIKFPKICLPASVVASASLSFAIIFSIFSLFLVVSGNSPGLPYLALFPTVDTAYNVFGWDRYDFGCAECVLPRHWTFFRHHHYILVLVDTYRLFPRDSSRVGAASDGTESHECVHVCCPRNPRERPAAGLGQPELHVDLHSSAELVWI